MICVSYVEKDGGKMISVPLWKRNVKVCRMPLLVIFAVLSMYVTVIIYMYNPELSEMLSGYQQALPEMMAAVGMTGVAANLLEWMQIYLYGFIMLLFPLIFILIMVQKLLMGPIEGGTLANLLATPNSRKKIICTQILSMIFFTALLFGMVTIVGIVSCEIMFPGELAVGRYLMLNVSTWLLQTAVTGIVFFVACCVSDSKSYYLMGAGLPVVFFLIQMVSNMGEKLEKLKYVTIYSLLPVEEIIKENAVFPLQNGVLFLIAAALFLLGAWQFQRRDLSL